MKGAILKRMVLFLSCKKKENQPLADLPQAIDSLFI